MKLKTVFLLALIPLAFAVADELDDFLNKLEKYKAEVISTYPKVIESKFRYVVHRHFAFAALDHDAAAVGLVQLSYEDLGRLQDLENRFQLLKLELSQSPEKIDALAAELFAMMGEAQAYKYRSDVLSRDIQVLQQSWNNYCYQERLTQLEEFFNPLGNFAPNGDLGFVSAPNIPYEFGISITMNESGDLTGYNASGPQKEEDEDQKQAEEAGWAVAAGVAAAACSPGVVLSAVCAGAVYAVKFLYDTISFGIEAKKINDKMNKQAELLREIYLLQLSAINRLATTTRSEVAKSCGENFPPKNEWHQEIFAKHKNIADTSYSQMKDYAEGEFQEMQAAHYEYLLNEYFPGVLKKYSENIKSYFVEKVQLNQKIVEYTANSIIPRLEAVKTADKGAIRQALNKQDLWDQIIVGDALYREDKSFGFIKKGENAASFPNRWDEISRQIIKEAQP